MNNLKIELWSVDRVTPHPKNPKKHPESQVATLAEAIKKFGWDQPIVVDRDGVIIKGHGRRLAAIKLGLKEVPVLLRADLSPEEADAARVSDNYAVSNDYDQDLMRELLRDLRPQLEGIVSTKELDFAVADLGTINLDPFIENLDVSVAAQEDAAHKKADEVRGRRIPLAKAFGFKDIAGEAEILVTRWLAKLEDQTKLKGEAALIAFLQAGA
jgi:hypothetical protein